MENFFKSKLQGMLSDPSAFSGTPGFQFALNTGLDSVNRKLAAGGMSNSGNALAELTKYGTGLAMQDYGNQIDRLGRLSGQEDQFGLGTQQNANTAQNNAWNFGLGQQRNANDAQNNWWNYSLGKEQNANAAANNQNNFNLGLGQNAVNWQNANTNRGNAQSQDYYRGQQNQIDWGKFYQFGGK